jgi:hypothetical protein
MRGFRWVSRLMQPKPVQVSADCLAHHLRHEISRGVDLPTWRTPREVQKLRRAEARQMRIVRRQA